MKLLFIHESPLARVNGDYYAGDPSIRVARYLANHCQRTTVWAPAIVGHPTAAAPKDTWRLELGNLRIEENTPYNSFVGFYKAWPRKAWEWARTARRLIREHDAVVIRVPAPMLSLVTRRAFRARRPIVLIIWGDTATQSDRLIASRGLKRMFYSVIVKAMLRREIKAGRNAAIVYAFSKDIADRHRGSRGLVKVIQDPHLSLADFVDRADTCQGQPIRLVRVCWLIPSKGLEYLLESVALLCRKGLPIHLELIGKERTAGYQRHLEELAGKLGISANVTFSGWVPFDRIGDVFLRSDIHVISSLAEGTPRVIVEGFARGVPVVATAVGGCVDSLTHERDALLVPPANPAALADAVERLVRDGDLRRRLIGQGYTVARQATCETLGMEILKDIERIIPESTA